MNSKSRKRHSNREKRMMANSLPPEEIEEDVPSNQLKLELYNKEVRKGNIPFRGQSVKLADDEVFLMGSDSGDSCNMHDNPDTINWSRRHNSNLM